MHVRSFPSVQTPCAPTQPTPGEKHPEGQLQTGMVVVALAGPHPQAPTAQESGNEMTFAQQMDVPTVPPVEVQSSSAGVEASASPLLASSPTSASGCPPAAPTDVLRSHAAAPLTAARIAHATSFAFIDMSGTAGQRASGSVGQSIGATNHGGKVRTPVLAAAGVDPQLATEGDELAPAGHIPPLDGQPVENGERFAFSMLGQENLDAQQPRFERQLTVDEVAFVDIETSQRRLAIVVPAPAP